MPNRRSARSWISASSSATQKREAEARKKQKIIEIKEIKFRPGTDDHDYQVKMRSVLKFLEEGDQVRSPPALPRPRNGPPRGAGAGTARCVAADVGDKGKVGYPCPSWRPAAVVMMIGPK